MNTRRQLLATAHHEAGHAVTALAHGITVKHASIGLSGKVELDYKPVAGNARGTVIAILIGGLVAELLHSTDRAVVTAHDDLSVLLGGSDTLQTAELIKDWILTDVTSLTQVRNVAAWDDVFSTRDFTTQDLLDAVIDVKAILREHADAHAALVTALVKKGWLTGKEVTRVWETASSNVLV
jgi:hypothetical protein